MRALLSRTQVPEPVDLITCDASFIGLATVLPAPLALAAENASLVALVKPQFEAGPGRVGKGGVVRDPAVHQRGLRARRRLGRGATGLGDDRHRRKPDPRS